MSVCGFTGRPPGRVNVMCLVFFVHPCATDCTGVSSMCAGSCMRSCRYAVRMCVGSCVCVCASSASAYNCWFRCCTDCACTESCQQLCTLRSVLCAVRVLRVCRSELSRPMAAVSSADSSPACAFSCYLVFKYARLIPACTRLSRSIEANMCSVH